MHISTDFTSHPNVKQSLVISFCNDNDEEFRFLFYPRCVCVRDRARVREISLLVVQHCFVFVYIQDVFFGIRREWLMMNASGKQSSVRASHLRPTNMASNDAILSRSECFFKSPEAQRRVHEDHQDDVHDQDRSVLSLSVQTPRRTLLRGSVCWRRRSLGSRQSPPAASAAQG